MTAFDLSWSCDKNERKFKIFPAIFRYIKIYGLNFSKEDHIALIKLFYELITIPDLEPTRVNKCAFTLTQLLK